MPVLVSGIHVFLVAKTWMAGTSPAMTMETSKNYRRTITVAPTFARP